MATHLKNLSDFDPDSLPSGEAYIICIVVSEWNTGVTFALAEGARSTLINAGVSAENIRLYTVPGSFELPLAASWAASEHDVDAVICLGCVIQGETRHFEFISQAVAQGVTRASLDTQKPVIFGVLTTDTLEQAEARSGGKHGNKGIEGAVAALRMLSLKKAIKGQ
ncbi:MAG: 6,7-dimethyl-8-ribityllumazine synthase [Bacteroidota bacterium]